MEREKDKRAVVVSSVGQDENDKSDASQVDCSVIRTPTYSTNRLCYLIQVSKSSHLLMGESGILIPSSSSPFCIYSTDNSYSN